VFGQVALGLEAEAAVFAGEGAHVRVRPDMFLEHRRFFAADAAFLAHVLAAAPAAHVSVLLVRLEAAGKDLHPLWLRLAT